MFLATSWFGVALLDADGRPVKTALFPKEPAELAERLQAVLRGEILEEERSLAPEGGVGVADPRLLRLAGARLAPEPQPRLAARASEFDAPRALLHQVAIELGRRRYRESAGGRDQHVLMAVDAVDDLASVANEVSERLREWYGLHYPELDRVDRHEEFVALLAEHGTRERIQAARPDLPKESMGAPLEAPEAEVVRQLARLASRVYQTRADLEKYLEDSMPKLAPNVTAVLGASLAARIIRLAGGLSSLARMPSGTIQTLGAEKALFRHLREGKRPPKHGVLLQHPLLHRAPKRNRGALARALAGKVALAARADEFTHASISATLESDLGERARAIDRDRSKVTRRGARPGARGPPRGGKPWSGGPARGGREGGPRAGPHGERGGARGGDRGPRDDRRGRGGGRR